MTGLPANSHASRGQMVRPAAACSPCFPDSHTVADIAMTDNAGNRRLISTCERLLLSSIPHPVLSSFSGGGSQSKEMPDSEHLNSDRQAHQLVMDCM